jgi:hypothetical protein
VCGECEPLLRQARDELYHARVLAAGLRNRTKTDAAALTDSVQRMEALIGRVEAALNGSPRPKEAQGNGTEEAIATHAH